MVVNFLVTLPVDIKEEPTRDNRDSPVNDTKKTLILPATPSTASTAIHSNPLQQQQSSKQKPKVQSMIAVRKDYSYKYTQQQQQQQSTKSIATTQHEKLINLNTLDISSSSQQQKSRLIKQQKQPLSIRSVGENRSSSVKPNISILERYDYDKTSVLQINNFKGNEKMEQILDEATTATLIAAKPCAIDKIIKTPSMQPKVIVENLDTANILKVPIGKMLKRASENVPSKKQKKQKKKKRREKRESVDEEEEDEEDDDDEDNGEQLKVILAQNAPGKTIIKQEPRDSVGGEGSTRLKQQTLSTESKDSQNINKINNKINIIFQLNDNSKSLRKNIILHRRTPKKTTKITIKEANNNVNSNNNSKTPVSDNDATVVPEKSKILCTIETQTDDSIACRKSFTMGMSMSNIFLNNDVIEHLFFEGDILVSLQRSTISFYEYHRLSALLKKGETDFRFIDQITRRLHDVPVDDDNKLQRLCYNEESPLPIYVEMRAKQKELDDPDICCPIAFVYCNVYYIDQRNAKFSSVHLDTVKSVVNDICYTTIPKTCYFIMAWSERSLDLKNQITGIVKYKLTPNLDLAKLASIRQFPKLNHRIKQMYCGRGEKNLFNFFSTSGIFHFSFIILDSQLITTGDTQVSIFNYSNGDLLISLDLMKSYGTNLTTFEFEDVS